MNQYKEFVLWVKLELYFFTFNHIGSGKRGVPEYAWVLSTPRYGHHISFQKLVNQHFNF